MTLKSAFDQVRLPKLDLKTFDGNSSQWVSFINLFDTAIHKNMNISNVTKFQYLLSVLSGEPLSLVKSLNITEANYDVAYKLLHDRYHNPRRLTTLHLNQILDLPDVVATSIKTLRLFINLFHEHTQALKALDCDITSENNPLLSAFILRKMDHELRCKLEVYRSHNVNEGPTENSLPKVKTIIDFLNSECSQVEDANLHTATHYNKACFTASNQNKKTKLFS